MRVKLSEELEVHALSRAEARYIYREVFTENCYLRGLDNLGPRPLVLDVGANIGLFALKLLSDYPGARLHCFEPAPTTFEVLSQNLRGRSAKLHRQGLSDQEGWGELNFYPLLPGNSSLKARVPDEEFLEKMYWAARESLPLPLPRLAKPLLGGLARLAWGRPRRYPIPLLTLDRFLKELPGEVDLLKIDVERAELQVLAGVENEFPRIRRLVVEVTSLDQPGRPLEAVVDLLEAKGYRVSVEESEENRRIRRAIETQLGVDGRIDHLVVAQR